MTPRAEDLEEALAEFYAADPERARRIVAEHALDDAGRCAKCKAVGCSLRPAALRALARGPGSGGGST